MNAKIQQFDFDQMPVRVMERAGFPWFVAADVCEVLGIANGRDAVQRLEEDEKGVAITDTLGGPQNTSIISESGLYALIFKSRKPQAKLFRKWVTSEVLPAIRKTGSYAVAAAPSMHPVAVQFLNFFDSLHKRGVPVDQCSKTAGQVFQGGVQGFEYSQAATLPNDRSLVNSVPSHPALN